MVIRRRVVRAVMLTPDRRVLLMKIREPVSGFVFWVTPGGGLEPGESDKDALRREVAEETGATEDLSGKTGLDQTERVQVGQPRLQSGRVLLSGSD